MRTRTRVTAGAALLGLVASLTITTPAQAHVVDAYYGDRGHAWTNSDHTRVGVEDQRSDGIRPCLVYTMSAPHDNVTGFLCDDNNSDPGYSTEALPPGAVVKSMRVCGWYYPSWDFRSCSGDFIKVE